MVNIFQRALSLRTVNSTIAQKMGIKHVKGVLQNYHKFVGENEMKLRSLFADAKTDYALSKDHADPIIFDEIDAICKENCRRIVD